MKEEKQAKIPKDILDYVRNLPSDDTVDYRRMTAPCGLPCFACGFYMANRHPELKSLIAETYGVPQEKVACRGCRDEEGTCGHLPMACRVYPCVESKGIDFCHECTDFPCDYLHPYADMADLPHLETSEVRALDQVVDVDHKIEGCPIDAKELVRVIKSLLMGRKPFQPNYPVCVECKLRENVCRYEYDEICLGPVTRAGCDARCPSNGFWCFGCRGPVSDPNVHAATQVMAHYGKTTADLKRKLALFGTEQEPFHV